MARTLTENDTTDGRPPLGMRQEMNLIANERSGPADGDDHDVVFYNAHPDVANEIGGVVDDILASFEHAYPRDTRTAEYPNDAWSDGFPKLASFNDALGRKSF